MENTIYTHYLNLSVDDIEGEVWKIIPNTNKCYEISSLGRVKSYVRRFNWHFDNDRYFKKAIPIMLRQAKTKLGYLVVYISLPNKEQKFCLVHRLVAEAFCHNPLTLPFVHHRKNIRHFNTAHNLEWVTEKQNSLYILTEKGGYNVIDLKKDYDPPLVSKKVIGIPHDYTFIYALTINNGDEIIYVGKSDRPHKRVKEHISSSNRLHYKKWLFDIISDGKNISYKILFCCHISVAAQWESNFIEFYRKKSAVLYNVSDGIYMPQYVLDKSAKARLKPILQYDCKGNFIREWVSISEAGKVLNLNNAALCRAIKKKSTLNKYFWLSKKSNNYPNKIEVNYNYDKICQVLQYDKNGVFIKKWLNAATAAKELNITSSAIYRAIRNLCGLQLNCYWRFYNGVDIPNKIKIVHRKLTVKPIIQILKNGEEIKWDSMSEASSELKIDFGSLRNAVKNNAPIKGMLFKKDLSSPRWKAA